MTGGLMDSYRLVRAGGGRRGVGRAGGRCQHAPGAGAGPAAAEGGRWAVHGLVGIPDSIGDGATHEVELVATDGQCWRGRGRFAIFTHTDAAIAGAGDLGAC